MTPRPPFPWAVQTDRPTARGSTPRSGNPRKMKKKGVPKPPVRVIEYFFIRHTRHTLLPPLVSVVVGEAPIFDFTTRPTVAQVGSPPGSRGPAHATSTPSHCTHSSLPHCNHIPHSTSHPFCLHFSPLQPTCTQPPAQREAAFSLISILLRQIFWPPRLWPLTGWTPSSTCLDSRPVRGSR